MRRIRQAAVSVLSLICMLPVLSGCWDRTEINDLAFILTSALDLEPGGKIRYTVLVPLPGQMGGATGGGGGTGGDKSYYVDSEVGNTFPEVQEKLQRRMSRRMFLAHRRTILIGEDLARQGISNFFDHTPRSPESRMTTYLIITKGKAYELLQSNPRFERFPSETIRELAKTRAVIDMDMKDFGLALSAPGSDASAAYMSIRKSQKSEKPSEEVEIIGYALFRDYKMVGTVSGISAQGLGWLKARPVMATAMIEMEGGPKLTMRIIDLRNRIRVKIVNGKLRFVMNVEAKAKLQDSAPPVDMMLTSNVRKAEKALSDYIEKAMRSTLKDMEKLGVDAAQLGTYIWRAYPKLWEDRYLPQWPQALGKAEFDIRVNSRIVETGLINKNVLTE